MVLRDSRSVPLSLRRAVVLLGPLAALAVLLGAGSASAADPVPPPANVTLTPGPYGQATSPGWTYDLLAGHTPACSLTGPDGAVGVSCPSDGSPAQPVVPLTMDGSYAFSVTQTAPDTTTTDEATGTVTVVEGGTSDPATSSYVLDRAAPVVTATAPPSAVYTGWEVTVSTDGSPVTATCAWAGPAPVPGSGSTCNTGTLEPALTVSGEYTLTVTAQDAAGNLATPASAAFVYDGDAPLVDVALQTTPSTGAQQQPVWGFTANDGTVACTLTGPDGDVTGGSCDTTAGVYTAPTLSTSGTYTLTVRATDAAGNVGSDSAAYVLDLEPPAITLPADSTGTGETVSWTVAVTGATSISCTVTGATASTSSCSATGGTVEATRTTDGVVTLTVDAVDAYGNESTASVRYTRDSTPSAPVVTADPARSTDPIARWTFTTDDLTTSVLCRVDGPTGTGTIGSCDTFSGGTGTHSASLPADGTYTLWVFADNATSTATPGGSATYTLDRTEPAGPALTRTHEGTTGSSPTLGWTWTVLAGHTTYCRLSVNGSTGTWAVCDGAYSTSTSEQGTYVLQVVYRDDLLNEGSTSSDTYTFDSLAPAAPTVELVGASPRAAGDVTWTVSLTGDGLSAECQLLGPTGTSTGWGPCTMPKTLTADGVHELQARQYDAAGNVSGVASSTVTIDAIAPVAPTVPGADARTNDALVWSFSSPEPDVAFRCRLVVNGVAGSFDACTSNYSHVPTVQGTYRLDVRAVDGVGNESAITEGPTFTYDSLGPTAPTVTLAVTQGSTASATWSVTAAGDAVRHECRMTRTYDGGTTEVLAWSPCSAFTFALEAGDGVYVLSVRSYDDLDNVSDETTGPGYTLDATAPDAPVVSGSLEGTGNRKDMTYSWSTEDGATASCRLFLNGSVVATYASCHTSSPFPVTLGFGDGSYRLEVTVTDSFGNVGAAGLSDAYLLDTAPPAAPSITAGPPPRTSSTTLSWSTSLATVDGGVALECRLVRIGATPGDFTTCPAAYSDLADGTYRLDVRAVDAAGNRSAVTSSAEVTVDTVGPAAPTVTLAVTSGSSPSATWTVTASEPGLVECRLTRTVDGATTTVSDWATCTDPYTFALSAGDGVYTLHVRSYDDLGNVSPATTGPGYTLDATAPAAPTVVGSHDGTTNSVREVSYSYGGEGTATCSLYRDGVLVTPSGATCTATQYTATLPSSSGTYRLEVTFTDSFGNTSAPGVSGDYVLDVTPPDPPVVTGTRDGTTDNELGVTYTYTGEGTATCRLYRDGVLVEPAVASCTATTYTVTLPSSSGTYRLEVTFTDAYGNTSAPGVSGEYVLDVTPPGAATVTVTPRTDNVASATWTVTPPEGGTTTECRLLHGTTVVRDWHDCAAPYAYPLEAGDGAYVLEVRVTDAVGNLGPVAVGESYTLDTTPPSRPTVTSNRTQKDNERSVTYAFSGEGVATCQLTRDGVAVGDPVVGCTSGYTITLPDVSGRYVLLVTYEDAVGNVSPAGASPEYELDVTPPPAPTVTSDRSGRDNERTVTYEFSGEGHATCQLTRDGAAVGDAVPCTSPWVVELPTTDGEYVLLVTYTDAVGNPSEAGRSVGYYLDLTPPPAPVVSGPPATGNTRTVTWTYSGEGTASCTLLLGGVAYSAESACGATSFTVTLPSDGSWSLQVAFTDAVGNRGPPGTSPAYLFDTRAPVAPSLTGPTGPAQHRAPTWSISSESGTSVECRLTRGGTVVTDWTACAGSFTADLTGLPDGGYVLEARATDPAGNVSPVGTATPYVLDTTAPAAPVVTGPAGPSQSRTPRFTWTGESGARAECLLRRDGADVGGWVSCTSGFSPTLDRDGTWTLTVRLVDAAGNLSETATSGGYVLDTTAPPAPVVTPPQTPGRDLAPSWGVVVETGASVECRLVLADGTAGAWQPCALPHVTSLEGRPDGAYVLEVRATDVAGNVSQVGSGTYVLDTVSPAAAVLTSPTSPSRSRTPTFRFTVEPGATTRCRLTSGSTVVSDFAPCSSPVTLDLTGLPDGTYTLTVRVADAAGNPGPAATATYVLDTTGPAAPVLTLAPATPSPARSVTFAFTYEPGSTLICRLTSSTGATVREIASCASPLTIDLTGLPDGSYVLTVRAVDVAGNVGAALTHTHVLDSTALLPPTVTAPVSPSSSRTPRWTISSTATTECRLTRGTTVLQEWTVCSGSFTAGLFNQPDGTYTLSVRAKAATGAVSAAAVSRYVLDTTAPGAATVVPPPTPSTNRLPTWTIASADLGATAECRVLFFDSVLVDWRACAASVAGSPYSLDLTGRGDGTYTLQVRLTDAAGNLGAVTSSSFVLDTSSPVGVGVIGPPSPGNDLSPTWTFSTDRTVQLECRLTSADGALSEWEPCAGSYTAELHGMPDGTYTLAVRAVSEAGTPGPETTSAYVLSTALPDGPTALTLTGGTKPTDNDRSPTWSFTLPSGTTGRCVVTQGSRVVADEICSGTFTLDLSRAGDGSYVLTVTAVDAAGTASEGVSSTYVLDTVPTAPPVFTLEPGSPASTLEPQWRFTVVYGADAECRLLVDGRAIGDWAPCTTPYTLSLALRPDGRYTLEVRAVDEAGNSSAPRASTYVLDRTALPLVTVTGTPQTPSRSRDVTWTFVAPTGTTAQCRILSRELTTTWGACSTATSHRLDLTGRGDGDYVLEVRAVDADGRTGSASRALYTLDTQPPAAPSFSDVPGTAGNDATPSWSWDVPGDDRVECRLVRVGGGAVTAWAPCSSPYEARLTAQGTYALELRVVDAAGNVSAVTSNAYRYDTTPPAQPTFTSRPPSSGSDRTVSWTFVVPADATATCTVTRGASQVDSGPCSGRYDLDLSGEPDGTYTLTVRFTDAAGNVGPAVSSSYTLRTVGLTGPPRVDGPSTGGGGSRPTPTTPVVPGRGTTAPGPTSPGGSTSRPDVPTIPTDRDVVRSTVDRPGTTLGNDDRAEEAVSQPEPQESARARNPLLADPLPFENAPEALREAVTQTITRPTLPLALLAIVLLFLLAQNRIDRRDPKLAAAPVEAEPELDFTTIVRRPRGAHS